MKLRRHQRLAILASLILSGCNFPFPMWPDLPSKGLCRNFAMTSWGGGAPWDELRWDGKDGGIVHIDEPMLPQRCPDSPRGVCPWSWQYDPGSREDVCGPNGLGMVQGLINDARASCPTCTVWLNWSTDEIEWMSQHACGKPLGLDADVVSVDSYGGVADWPNRLEYLQDLIYRTLQPGQKMGLVPEAFICPGCGIINPQIDYVMLGSIYFDWAFERDDGRIFAIAPFMYQDNEGMLGMESMPQVAAFYAAVSSEYPRCMGTIQTAIK